MSTIWAGDSALWQRTTWLSLCRAASSGPAPVDQQARHSRSHCARWLRSCVHCRPAAGVRLMQEASIGRVRSLALGSQCPLSVHVNGKRADHGSDREGGV